MSRVMTARSICRMKNKQTRSCCGYSGTGGKQVPELPPVLRLILNQSPRENIRISF